EVAAPGGRGALHEVVERLEAELAHPLGLVLVVGDVAHQPFGESLRGLVRVVGLGVVEAEALGVVGADALEGALLVGQLLGGGDGGLCLWGSHGKSSTPPPSLRRLPLALRTCRPAGTPAAS